MSTKTRNKRKKTTPVVIDLTSDDESIKTPPRPSKKVKQEKKKAPKKPPPPPSKPKATPKPKVPPSYPRPPPLDFKIPKKQASIPDRGDPIDSSSEESSVFIASRAQIDSWFQNKKPKEVIDYKGTIVVPQDIWIQVKAVQVNLQSHLLEVIRGALTCEALGDIFGKSVKAVRSSGNDFPNSLIRRHSEYNLDLKGKFVALPQETFQRARLELWFYYYLGRNQKVSYKEVREVIARTDIKEIQEKE